MRLRFNFAFGLALALIVVVAAIFAGWIAPYDPINDADLMNSEMPPSWEHWLGTDGQGRDVFSRVLYGAQVSLTVGLVSQLINSCIGTALGVSAGYFGGWWDDLVNGLTNVMLAIPSLVFALAIMAVLGQHADRRTRTDPYRSLGLGLPRPRDFHHGPRLQSAG